MQRAEITNVSSIVAVTVITEVIVIIILTILLTFFLKIYDGILSHLTYKLSANFNVKYILSLGGV